MQSDYLIQYEKKYLVTQEQCAALTGVLQRHMAPDIFSQYLVQNIYYDTDGWDAVRASIEKPYYKEKLRLRCYGVPGSDGQFFLELKKKYKGVVSKCRVIFPAAMFAGGAAAALLAGEDSQIARELAFYLQRSGVAEKVYLAYQRCAFVGTKDEGLRVTLDTDIRFRLDQLDLQHPAPGQYILPQSMAVLEIKTLGGTPLWNAGGGMPLWLSGALSECGVFPTSFSKYGACYTRHIQPAIYSTSMPERIPAYV